MHGLTTPTPLLEQTGALALAPFPAWLCGLGMPATDDACGKEEPEIVRLLAAHFRTMLMLRGLTDHQRDLLARLVADCESRLSGGGSGGPDALARSTEDCSNASRQPAECLTAIRLYAAGAQKALARGRPDAAVRALAGISLVAARAQSLLAAPGLPDSQSGQDQPPSGLFRHNPVG